MPQRCYRLEELARLIDADVKGDPDCLINGIMTLQHAKLGQISFLDNKRYLKCLSHTKASAVILQPEYLACSPCNALVTADPYLAFAKIAKLFERQRTVMPGIHPTAIVGEHCTLHPSVSIAAFCVIGANACLQEGVVMGPSCSIGADVKIGDNSRL